MFKQQLHNRTRHAANKNIFTQSIIIDQSYCTQFNCEVQQETSACFTGNCLTNIDYTMSQQVARSFLMQGTVDKYSNTWKLNLRINYLWQGKLSVYPYNSHNMQYQQSYSCDIQKHAKKKWVYILFLCIMHTPHFWLNLDWRKCILYTRLYGNMHFNSSV